jgi:hypothetical protein
MALQSAAISALVCRSWELIPRIAVHLDVSGVDSDRVWQRIHLWELLKTKLDFFDTILANHPV